MEYAKLNRTWNGLSRYNLNGPSQEHYSGPVTLSLPEWQSYVASGKNTLYGSGGVIPGPVESSGWTGAAVYGGHVHQGYM